MTSLAFCLRPVKIGLMSLEIEIHPAQSRALRYLLFNPKARFSQLNQLGLTTDHFNFHLKRLVKLGLVSKDKNVYRLTQAGKEFANRMDSETQDLTMERQAKIAVLVGGVKIADGVKKYLIQKRLKEPYRGFSGFITGKVKWGEKVSQAAARELKEEAGLKGSLTLVGVKHKMDYSGEKKLLEDKYFFVFRADRLEGHLKRKFEGGENQWLARSKILDLDDLFDGVGETIKMIGQEDVVFSETKYLVSKY